MRGCQGKGAFLSSPSLVRSSAHCRDASLIYIYININIRFLSPRSDKTRAFYLKYQMCKIERIQRYLHSPPASMASERVYMRILFRYCGLAKVRRNRRKNRDKIIRPIIIRIIRYKKYVYYDVTIYRFGITRYSVIGTNCLTGPRSSYRTSAR